jgi:hypothetical protein
MWSVTLALMEQRWKRIEHNASLPFFYQLHQHLVHSYNLRHYWSANSHSNICVYNLLFLFIYNSKPIACNIISGHLFRPTYRSLTRLCYAIFASELHVTHMIGHEGANQVVKLFIGRQIWLTLMLAIWLTDWHRQLKRNIEATFHTIPWWWKKRQSDTFKANATLTGMIAREDYTEL